MQSIHSLYFSLFQHSTLFPPLLYRIPPHSPFSLPSRSPLCTLDSSSSSSDSSIAVQNRRRKTTRLSAGCLFFSYVFVCALLCSSTLCRREWFLFFFWENFRALKKRKTLPAARYPTNMLRSSAKAQREREEQEKQKTLRRMAEVEFFIARRAIPLVVLLRSLLASFTSKACSCTRTYIQESRT